MEIALKNGMDSKLCDLVSNFKLENIENMLLQMFDNAEKSESIHYIGELNQNDVMF